MDYKEIALQLTLQAMDKNYITCHISKGGAVDVTADNAEEIADFYNKVYNKISKETVQCI